MISIKWEIFLDIFPHTWHPLPVTVHLLQFGMSLKVCLAFFSQMQTTTPILYRNLYIYVRTYFLPTGLGTPIRHGLSSISLVRWSPSGDYLLAAKLYASFRFPYLLPPH
jgi:hypothetical protein